MTTISAYYYLAFLLLIINTHATFGGERSLNAMSGRQDNDIVFHRLNTEQGLSQSNVYAIAQDRIGFMWIATADGLSRYDGSTFKVFRRIPGDKTTLSDNFITALLEDRPSAAGTLWVGTRDGGLNRFDNASGTFTAFKNNPQSSTSISSNNITALYYDKQGTLWIGTDYGLNRFDPKTGLFKVFLHEANNPTSISANDITALLEDSNGNLWVGTSDGLNILNRATNQFRAIHRQPRASLGLESNDISALAEDSQHTIWVGTVSTGLYHLDPRTERVVEHFRADFRISSTMSYGGLLSNNIRTLYYDSKNELWVGTAGGGLHLFDPAKHSFAHYRYDPASNRSLSGNIVFAMYEDRSGAYWIGTYGNGLNVFHAQANVFLTTVCNPQNPNDMLSNSIYALLEDRNGLVWIGTEQGLVRYNRLNRQMYSVPETANKKSAGTFGFVRNIIETQDGKLWLATENGLHKLDPKTMRRTAYKGTLPAPDSALRQHLQKIDGRLIDQTFVLHESRDGLLWVGTRGVGVKVFNPRIGAFVAHYLHDPEQPSLSHNFVRCIKEDSAGRIWFGTRGGGLSRFNPRTGEWRTFRHDDNNPNSLSHDAIFSLHFSTNNLLWIGTQGGGICCMDVEREQFVAWKEEHGLANNVVYAVLEDAHGDLWMSTHQGLSRMTPPSASNHAQKPLTVDAAKAYIPFRNYNAGDGLQNNEFNAGAYCKGASGRLYFGGLQGFNDFFADSVRVNSYIPPIVFTGFRRFGEEVSLGRDISLMDTISISYKDNVFSLEFAALSFVQSDENRFKYMLDGVDTKWISSGTRHEARYTNLSGGDYIFHVKASNNDGIWNETGRMLFVRVMPPFWERWWFRLLGALTIGFVGVVAYKGRMRIIERRAKELEREVALRTVELRESNDRLQNANEEIQRQVALLDEQTREIEIANASFQEKNLELEEERHTSEGLILNVLPPLIAKRLRAGEQRIADSFDSVSVLFADIVGFTELATKQPPHEVVDILNTVFSAFDIFSERYQLEKIKTIGDAYMIVGGVPEPIDDHIGAIADMAIEMLQTLEILRFSLKIPLEVRIGVHTGPVVAGIIGQKKFSYDLWGDTVNTASRMESHGDSGKIHCTREIFLALQDRYDFEPPRYIDVKGKGVMETYFLVGKKKPDEKK
jgi:ligand-binding sensor domain-containing protein/class 3 adenylate cyclase